MYTDFIPLPEDETERLKILQLIRGLDNYFPDSLTITRAICIETANPRMAELLESIFHPNTSQAEPEPEPKTKKQRSKNALAISPPALTDQPTVDLVAKTEESIEVVLAPNPNSGPTVESRPCDECKNAFVPHRKAQRFCSKVCSKTWHNREQIKKGSAPRPDRHKVFSTAYKNALAKSVLAN